MKTAHLDSKAALRWQWGEATETERAHMAACSTCRAQVEPLAEALGCFTLAARQWGDAKAAAAGERHPSQAAATEQWRHANIAAAQEWRAAKTAAARPRRGMAFAGAAVCSVLVVIFALGLPGWQAHQHPPQAAAYRQPAEQQKTQDDALLEAIDRDVSQVVPAALTPLSGTGPSPQ
jgi:hypothetical protein